MYLKCLQVPHCGASVLRLRQLKLWELVEGGCGRHRRVRELPVAAERQTRQKKNQITDCFTRLGVTVLLQPKQKLGQENVAL